MSHGAWNGSGAAGGGGGRGRGPPGGGGLKWTRILHSHMTLARYRMIYVRLRGKNCVPVSSLNFKF